MNKCGSLYLGLSLLVISFIGSFAHAMPPRQSGIKGSKMTEYKKPTEEELKKKLTAEQFEVTQREGTEAAFHNAYWDNKQDGIYVDVVSGEPLFSSLDKFDSGTGWPSFTRPLVKEAVLEKADVKLFFIKRVEVRSKVADSHLGHVFDDGPAPTGKRYCLNSASLRFVPAEKLEEEGYGQFVPMFAAKLGKKGGLSSSATATMAGGCFWGVQDIIRKLPGVIESHVGYAGGSTKNPTYEDVKTGRTGHAEAVEVVFDPTKISYEEILEYFFRLHDPTTLNKQGNDRGTQYRSAIFYHTEAQKEAALKVKEKVDKSGKWKSKVVTEIVPFGEFYKAEEYHQDYLVKHPTGYTCHYLRD